MEAQEQRTETHEQAAIDDVGHTEYIALAPDRSGLTEIKAMKFKPEEVRMLEDWGVWLTQNPNPATGMPYMRAGEDGKVRFAELLKFCINTAFNLVGQIARLDAKKEEGGNKHGNA